MWYKNFKLAPHLNNNNLNNDDTKRKLADPVFDAINQILTPITTLKYISYYILSNLCYISMSDLFLMWYMQHEGQIKRDRISNTKSGDNFAYVFDFNF